MKISHLAIVTLLIACAAVSSCVRKRCEIPDSKSIVTQSRPVQASRVPRRAVVSEHSYGSPTGIPVAEPVLDDEIISHDMAFHDESVTKATKSVEVNTDGGDQIIVSDDYDITVNGSKSSVIISGRCVNLVVKGDANEIHCDVVMNVSVSGSKNQLTFGSIKQGAIPGDGNKLTWERGIDGKDPGINVSGSGNVIKKQSKG